jgi:hypothetical protein
VNSHTLSSLIFRILYSVLLSLVIRKVTKRITKSYIEKGSGHRDLVSILDATVMALVSLSAEICVWRVPCIMPTSSLHDTSAVEETNAEYRGGR